jgi:N-acetylglucosaminyl-diphospho-decaprenol L-rhamnosyltransferase
MEWVPIVFFLLKKSVYDRTRGFDDRMWFHVVDMEWCRRILNHGFRIHFTSAVQVIHLGGASSKGLEHNLISDNFKGLLYFTRKHYPESIKAVAFFVKQGLMIRSFFYTLTRKRDLAVVYSAISKEIKA